MVRLGINGYGRIGRCVLRALEETGWREHMAVVAINEPAPLASIAHLTRFDSVHGPFPGSVQEAGEGLLLGGRPVAVSHATEAGDVDWGARGVDLLLECSGTFADRATATRHLAAGAPRVLVSHPMADAADVDATVVFGVNQHDLNAGQRLVSNASCSTNCLLPVLRVVARAFGIRAVSVTTLHSVMNDQPLLDGYHSEDLRRTRSGLASMVPVPTGLARGILRFLPELEGRIHAQHVRVPTLNVSALDVSLQLEQATSRDALNACLLEASRGELAGVLGHTAAPHASGDFNHDPRSGIVDATQTQVSGELAHLLLWFDNEWGFANRMLDVAGHWLGVDADGTPDPRNHAEKD